MLLLVMIRLPPGSPLFPYTTLFRSSGPREVARSSQPGPRHATVPTLFHRRTPQDNHARHHRTCPAGQRAEDAVVRSEEHTSELQSPDHLVCRLLLEKKKSHKTHTTR